ncbi:ArsB/NhaD family transporter, partial [Bacillus pumilus]|uniref:ArsB/NhaD family transporter n=1 Tax=Bacillus pumilus TaxID=1408 RepID=UPI0034D982DF
MPASIQQPPSHPFLPPTIFIPLLPPLLSSLINNLPTLLIHPIPIPHTHTPPLITHPLIYPNLIPSNLPPKITPIPTFPTF